ncbi:hypothetical protein L249_2621 [Ophiocordyceps polyrhachis-furcata BCC 54312]|uniref:Uncharacterized protein n=1 Tax=Ophiocordyceps polyrhachis-furcata BCC 54312 TaxID=1330021 RepID=A0A367LNR7_9HYPO|nr:hypothetical protein L249_2621 [Ophiocordyceps polyrhachis-furcata BCC 54312]
MQISVILNYSELIRGPTVTGIAWLALEVNNVTRLIANPSLSIYALILFLTNPASSTATPRLSSGDLLRPAYNGFRLYRLSYPQPSHNDLP